MTDPHTAPGASPADATYAPGTAAAPAGPTAATTTPDPSRLPVPRWWMRLSLGLALLLAVGIGALALMVLLGMRPVGLGGLLFALFWIAAALFCLWTALLVPLYLRLEGWSPRARTRTGGIAALALLVVAVLAMAVLVVT